MAEQRTGAQALQLYESPRPRRNERHDSFAIIHHFNLCFATFGRAAGNEKAEAADEKRQKDEEPRTTGGWKTMPFIIGNEACEKLAVAGLGSNMVVYLVTKYNMKKVAATNMLNIWSGTTSLATLPGAFLADSYIGRFWAITIGCFSYLLGMSILTATAVIPRLRPSSCSAVLKKLKRCERASAGQFLLLVLVFAFKAIGSAGVKPSNMAFGADQFEQEGEKGKKRVQSFFNWYYFSSSLALIVSLTVIVYIQSNVSWGIGFGICTAFMVISTGFFLLGRRTYRHEVPWGSAFTGFAQVIVASIRKRSLLPPSDSSQLYHGEQTGLKPRPTNQFRFLNRAAIITEGDIRPDGSSPVSSWRICSVQQIEELKSIMRTVPIFSCGIANQITNSQQHTFSVLQALSMDRRLGSKGFQIPAGSFSVFSLLVLIAWLPFYDRVVVPMARRVTKDNRGITMFQRMGIGFFISALSMLVAGLVEVKRRSTALNHGLADQPSAIVPISALWLVPQFCIAGLAEAFHTVGNLEFFYDQFPATMRSTAIAMSSCTAALGHYLSATIVTVVHNTTGRDGRPDWLDDNLNRGHLEYFYWLLSIMEALNLIYFIACARWYKYADPRSMNVNLDASTSCLEMECMQP